MTTNPIHRESERDRGRNVFIALVLAAAGLFMTVYNVATISGLIVRWLARAY